MTSFEWLTVAYLAGLVAAAWGRQSRRRVQAAGYAAVVIALVSVARFTAPSVRAWLPHAYLVLGYWLPALLTPVPTDRGFERRLVAADARLWQPGGCRLPSWTRNWFELAYLLCYPIIPISFAVVWAAGTAEDVIRFWLAVLTAGFACYATLPWTAAWPPRVLEPRDYRGLASVNLRMLRWFSHGLNTFPSGHVAVAVAASLGVAPVWPLASAAIGAIAASIAVAAAIGRYHYVVDVIAGLLVGLLAWALADSSRPLPFISPQSP